MSIDEPNRGEGRTGAARAQVPQPEDVRVTVSGTVDKVRQAIGTGGEIARFAIRTLRALPDLRHHTSEVFHQTGILILSTGLILWLMQFVIGYQCGLEAKYVLDQIGAPLYSGVFNAWCAIREMAPYMWGYIVAAKIGCGLVAEIGSMRISEEIDAMEVMGVRSLSYLVGTRVVAAWIAIPFLYTVGLGVMYVGEYLVTVVMLGGVSAGGYSYIFWLYQTPSDFVFSMLKVMAMSTAIVFVGCYYGYHARGGPVGVGKNTAKSMMLNMVLIHIIGFSGTALFWGAAPNAPIAN
ncbi:ABC transporter permease [Haloechinothrix sp. YIM 98757]|uniref:ABC transporter permease n=1 Tax=Haloechinothrix aidingensis TaxID=2752311 RepID=A0A838AB87_9PSEU|nr:ABC transporter permease [Haloechinothrix aidingensis]MBA0126503.1 ABC transporter permease [Haloechinothrix aidingensis]